MRVRLKGINSKRKRLADGSLKIYYYAWKGGPPLRGEPGSPEFVASYNAAIAQKVTPPTGVLLALLFRFQESAEFQFGISPRTRRDYIKQFKRIERDFGDFPIRALDDSSSATYAPSPGGTEPFRWQAHTCRQFGGPGEGQASLIFRRPGSGP